MSFRSQRKKSLLWRLWRINAPSLLSFRVQPGTGLGHSGTCPIYPDSAWKELESHLSNHGKNLTWGAVKPSLFCQSTFRQEIGLLTFPRWFIRCNFCFFPFSSCPSLRSTSIWLANTGYTRLFQTTLSWAWLSGQQDGFPSAIKGELIHPNPKYQPRNRIVSSLLAGKTAKALVTIGIL